LESATDRGSAFIEHIGITVPDVVEATHFFEVAFGAKFVADLLSPEGVGDVTGAQRHTQDVRRTELRSPFWNPDHTSLHAVRVMSLGNGAQVELFEFVVDGQRDPAALSDLGVTHIGIQVDDIDAAAARIAAAGGHLFDGPRSMFAPDSDEENRFVYTRAPWGMLIELVTYRRADYVA